MPCTSEKYKTDYFFKKENNSNPIVFIHGVGLTKEIWKPQVEFFKDILCEYLFLRPTFEVLEANLMISLLIISLKKIIVGNIQRV